MSPDKSNKASLRILETEYNFIQSLSFKFCEELRKQLIELLDQKEISLAFPIESRVKEWQSLAGKIEGKLINISSIKEINDLIGLRIILLFRSDLAKTYQIIENNFKIFEKEDTYKRLRENEFGYLSVHYVIELPETWFVIPTFATLHGFKAEIQVRTAAQHIWATASHKLQYKKESGVPIPIRRSIHRVSALLETVDLELDRVLDNRAEYIEQFAQNQDNELLNVDLLKHILDIKLPNDNRDLAENYSALLDELFHFEINTPLKLDSLLDKHIKAILENDAQVVSEITSNPDEPYYYSDDLDRIKKGVFYTHIGLVRSALELEFGEKWKDYNKEINQEVSLLEP